jgi:hypothetical protein
MQQQERTASIRKSSTVPPDSHGAYLTRSVLLANQTMRCEFHAAIFVIFVSVTLNSLIPAKHSLFLEIFSRLIFVRNCAKSDCGAAVSCYEIDLGSPEIAKFPVKFPVSREFAWRLVRSALRRQPGSAATGDCSLIYLKNARQWRTFSNW